MKWRSANKLPFFYFHRLETELKNLIFIKSYDCFKIVFRYSNCAQKFLTSPKSWDPANLLAYFSHALIVHYHFTKFLFSSMPLSRAMGRKQKCPQAYKDTKEHGLPRVTFSEMYWATFQKTMINFFKQIINDFCC